MKGESVATLGKQKSQLQVKWTYLFLLFALFTTYTQNETVVGVI